MSKKKLKWMNFLRYANLAFSFGLTMVAAVFLGIYGGWWLDRRLGTFPVFMLLGVFLGVGVGFYNLWSELARLMEKESGKKSRQKDTGNDENDTKRK